MQARFRYRVAATALAATLAPPTLTAIYETPDNLNRTLVEQLAADANAWSARCQLVVRHGDPAIEWAQAAEVSRADVVVVRALSGMPHRLTGSLSQRLSRQRRWVLTVVP